MDAMRPSPLLTGLAWLLLCQSAGEALTRLARFGLPGPVIGMLILVVLLRWRFVREPVGAVTDALLAHLSLLFVPVGVGVMTYMALLSQYGPRLLVALARSTWIGLIVTALVLRATLRRTGAPPDKETLP
jgi:holin-like protein